VLPCRYFQPADHITNVTVQDSGDLLSRTGARICFQQLRAELQAGSGDVPLDTAVFTTCVQNCAILEDAAQGEGQAGGKQACGPELRVELALSGFRC
jgi:hypothetical protein